MTKKHLFSLEELDRMEAQKMAAIHYSLESYIQKLNKTMQSPKSIIHQKGKTEKHCQFLAHSFYYVLKVAGWDYDQK